MGIFNPTEEQKLHQLISQALQLSVKKKTKDELIKLLADLANQSDHLLEYIDERVRVNCGEKLQALEQTIKRKDESLEKAFDIIRQTEKKLHETEEALAKATTHSENWGGARAGAGRKSTGIKRYSRKVFCTTRMAAAFTEYGKQLGKKSLKSILKKQDLEEKWDYKIRFLYLSKEEWDAVKPLYREFKENGMKAILE